MRKKVYDLFRTLAMFLVIVMTFGAFDIQAAAGESDERLTVTFHYTREDNDYSKWSLWLWEDSGEGSDNSFQGTDESGAYYNMTVGEKTSKIGYIVRTPDWEKDVEVDRFIDVSNYISGNIDVYLQQGVAEPRIEDNNATNGVKITSTQYSSENNTITVKTSAAINDYADMEVYANSGTKVDNTSVTKDNSAEDGNVYVIQLSDSLSVTKGYHVKYKGISYAVIMPNIYSTEEFEDEYTYEGDDLGANWSADKTIFKVWAPTADSINVCLYESGAKGTEDLRETIPMTKGEKGVWIAEKSGDLNGTYYTYMVTVDNEVVEAVDPYAKATGVNGDRSMVINLETTNPEGWDSDTNPHQGENQTDAIVYELSVRDFSVDASSGVTQENRGKYLAFTEHETKNTNGDTTGIDYLKNLGVTHVQLLPIQDFDGINEENPSNYNWGYATKNFNVPEGSYSTDPYNGATRIKEVKTMIKELHDNDMSVVLDVVYNHVFNAPDYCYNQIVPNYFTRISDAGVYSNGSYCGNDTASERSMVRKYIVDSILYWAEEYHIDGFRFDLAGVLDTETINEIVAEVRKVNPSIILYGEGWTMPSVSTKDGTVFATQVNSAKTPGFGYFDDRIRGYIKGGSNDTSQGYVTGKGNAFEIRLSVQGNAGWTKDPKQIVNYVSAHDDATLWDKLQVSSKGERSVMVQQNKLASAIVFASQGTTFMHAGEEMLRTKVDDNGEYVHDSYKSPDSVNSIKWDDLSQNDIAELSEYYKGLIAFRNAHPSLRMTEASQIAQNITFIDEDLDNNVVAYVLNGANVKGETSKQILIAFNPHDSEKTLALPEGNWDVCVNGEQAGIEAIGDTVSGTLTMDAYSAYMLVQGEVDLNEQKVTVYYKAEGVFAESAYLGYGLQFEDGSSNWDGAGGTLMETSEYDGYKKLVINTPNAVGAEVWIRDESSTNYDKDGENNYLIGPVGSYVIADGKVHLGVPTEEEKTQEVTVYYKTSDAETNMLYGLFGSNYSVDGSWSGADMLDSDYEGYKIFSVNSQTAESVQVCFNDKNNNWDNNGGSNYTIGAEGSYVIEDGMVYVGTPETKEIQVTVYYKNPNFELANMGYKVDSADKSMQTMVDSTEYEGYKELTILVDSNAKDVQVYFNDGGNNWDSNNGANYTIGIEESYVIEDGSIRVGIPVVKKEITVYYKNPDFATAGIGYKVNGTDKSMQTMTDSTEYEGYKEITIFVDNNAESVQVYFNDGGSIWDSNNDYTIGMEESYVIESGKVYVGNPNKKEVQVTVYYKNPDFATASMGYKVDGVDKPMKAMSDSTEYDGYKELTILVDSSATEVLTYFNDGGSNWDSNNDYTIGLEASYVIKDGTVRVGFPSVEDNDNTGDESNKEETGVTVYYKNPDFVTASMGYKVDGIDKSMQTMADAAEYEGYKELTILVDRSAESVQVYFNDGGDNWDSNSGANYTIGLETSYVIEGGTVRVGTPVVEGDDNGGDDDNNGDDSTDGDVSGGDAGNDDETPEQKPAETPEQKPAETPEQKPAETPEQKSAETPEQKTETTPEQKPETIPEQKPEATSEQKPEVIPAQKTDETPEQTADEIPEQKSASNKSEKVSVNNESKDGYKVIANISENSSIFTKEEINSGKELKAEIKIESKKITKEEEDAVSEALKKIGKQDKIIVAEYVDIDFFKIVGGQSTQMTKLNGEMEVIIEIPEKYRGKNNYSVIRIHENDQGYETTVLNDHDNNPDTISIWTDRFSTYAIAYEEAGASPEISDNTVWLWAIIAMAVGAVIVGFVIKYYLKKENDV